MKSLVTGAAGFIGSHLTDLLLDRGEEVVGIDDFSNGNPGNLARAAQNPGFRFIKADVADHAAVAPAFDGVDRVFHLAALADIVPSIEHPLTYHRSNVDGTASVLEAARLAGVKRFVYAASSSCYGLATEFPTPETAAIAPAYPYALTKWMGECCVTHWNKVYGLPTVSLRLFNVYGPRARTSGTYGAVFGVFLAQKLANRPFTVVGDGTQTRDFTFVSDVARAFAAAADSDLSGEIMNVGSGGSYSVNRLVELLGGPVVHIPKRPGEPDCTFADTSRILELLDWRPLVGLEDGVKAMLDHIEDWRGAPVWDQTSIAEATRSWFQYLKG
jgi:UDP-glucose 4-epimerase